MASICVGGSEILFDDSDLPIVMAYAWFLNPQGYACTKIKRKDGSRRTIGMHRVILGDPDSSDVDHINRIKTDNRRENLRACTRSENMRNKRPYLGKPANLRGVTYNKSRGKWQVAIRVNGNLTWFGYHDTAEDASKVAAPYFAGIAP